MRLPELLRLNKSEKITNVFGGYNHNLKIGEGEFYNTENITSDFYPTVSPRSPRGVYMERINPLGMIDKDGLCYVDGESIVIGGHRTKLGLSTDEGKCPKRLVSSGAYIIVFPDKKYINTVDFKDFGSLEGKYESSGKLVRFVLSREDGTDYESVEVSDIEPTDPENMDYWLDTSGNIHVLKQYSAYSETWVSVTTTYVRIEAEGIGKAFSEGDGVKISGIIYDTILDLNGNCIIHACDENYIVVTGILKEIVETTDNICVDREVPDMDFVISHENRLWGCRYGLNKDGKFVNEIYASKLGDFKNWNCFAGISTDSYALSLGTGGNFTGAIAYSGYPLFFKEGCIHKILGHSPSTFQLSTTQCDGVEEGSANSLVNVNGVLYYKSTSGVCAYSGSFPNIISKALGKKVYRRATAGTYKGKYYVSMEDTENVKRWVLPVVSEGAIFLSQVLSAEVAERMNGKRLRINAWNVPEVMGHKMRLTHLYESIKTYTIDVGIRNITDYVHGPDKITGILLSSPDDNGWNLFVYDAEKGIWVREDSTRVDAFCSVGAETYYIEHGKTAIHTIEGKVDNMAQRVRWFVESGNLGTDTPDKKYVSRLNVRLSLDVGSSVAFSIQYDSSGEWVHFFSAVGDRLRSFDVPVKIRRCDHFNLKIEGNGPCKIYSITKTVEEGSRK